MEAFENIELPLRDICEELKTHNKMMEVLIAELKNMDLGIFNGFSNIHIKLASISSAIDSIRN
jgi:hypothetical protein